MRPPWKVGVTAVKSFKCPVPSHGSLVRKTSPSSMVSSGYLSRKLLTDAAIAFTCPGVPVTACASIRPSVSKAPAEMSPASRAEVLNAVRTRVWACSSTTDRSRFHWICIRIRSSAVMLLIRVPPR